MSSDAGPDSRGRSATRGGAAAQGGGSRWSAVLAVVLLLLAAAVVTLVRPAGGSGPSVPGDPAAVGGTGSGTGRPVDATTLGCPDLAAPAGVASSVTVGLAPAQALADVGSAGTPGDGDPGDGDLGDLAGGMVRAGQVVQLARGAVRRLPAGDGPLLSATGPAAVGLFGFRSDRRTGRPGGSGEASSLAAVPCVAPRAPWWFTGAGADLDHSSTLVVTNLDAGPAVVDLRVLGREGEVSTAASRGVVVAPGARRRFDLVDVAPQSGASPGDLAVEVRATRGRVAAAVLDTRSRSGATVAVEWLPPTSSPARSTLLAGLPPRPDTAGRERSPEPVRRTVTVANPADLEAVVRVSVSGASGTFTPTGVQPLTIAPGAVASLDLSDVLPPTEPVALRLASRVPVVATVRSTSGDDALAGPTLPLTGPAAAPVLPGATARVQVTALRAARPRVEAYDGRGRRLGGTTLDLAAGATGAWAPSRGASYVVVRPDADGVVAGAVSYGGDGGLTVVPLVDLPVREVLPRVRPGLR